MHVEFTIPWVMVALAAWSGIGIPLVLLMPVHEGRLPLWRRALGISLGGPVAWMIVAADWVRWNYAVLDARKWFDRTWVWEPRANRWLKLRPKRREGGEG